MFSTLHNMGWPNTWHTTITEDIGSNLLSAYTHSLREDIICHAGSHAGCTREQNNPRRGLGGKFCNNKSCPLVFTGCCGWLVWIILWAGKKVKHVRLRIECSEAGSPGKGTNHTGSHSQWLEDVSDGSGRIYS
uniref:Uncharacterized protein n=1 Tax=Rousettus aegyptiacus TaxID=9407 RepID=A0A7J8KBG1_ROUAE|nr:hypothetical protein HJG63_007988 [Rousettus aegyptiacus]